MEYVNLTPLISCIRNVMIKLPVTYEVIIVDDYSGDGSDHLCSDLSKTNPLLYVSRKSKKRSLSLAVLEGLRVSTGQLIVVMDADLSHPPDKLPQMLNKLLRNEADFVIGSRYVKGSIVESVWPWYRRINSYVATAISNVFFSYVLNEKLIGRLQDPMAGFFSFKRECLCELDNLSPIGYKISLELLVKGNFSTIVEVPIHFADRKFGTSKLGFKQQILYLVHLLQLFDSKYPRKYSVAFVLILVMLICIWLL